MSRPTRQPSRSELDDPEEIDAFDRVVARASDPTRGGFIAAQQTGASSEQPGFVRPVEEDAGYYGRLLLAPTLAYHLSEMGRLVRSVGDRENSYTHAEREFVDQVLSADLKTNVIQPHHIPDALASGVRFEALEALHYGRESDLTEEELALARFIRAVVGGTMTDELWAKMEESKGERWVVEYAIFVLYLQMTMRMQQAVGLPDPSDAEMEQLMSDLQEGRRTVPEFTNRAG
jgi:hypothetical protein